LLDLLGKFLCLPQKKRNPRNILNGNEQNKCQVEGGIKENEIGEMNKNE
jgi:hypothetical protein